MNSVETSLTTPRQFSLASAALAAAVLVSGIFASCTKRDTELNLSDDGQITLTAAVGTSSVQTTDNTQYAAQSKAPALGATDALELSFARADESAPGTYGNYAATALTAARAAGSGAVSLIFNPLQYYRVDGLKTKLTGWYPGGAAAAGDVSGKGYYDGATRTVRWTIDGQQDVMTAPTQQGSRTSAMPSMTFGHRLTQLRFHPYAQSQTTVDAWGKITRIDVIDQKNTVTYALADEATGAVSFSGAATNIFSAGIAAGGAALSLSTTGNKAIDAKQMGNAVMIVPQSAAQSAADYTLALRVYNDKNQMKTITLTQALQAGVPYRIYMHFNRLDITLQAVVAQWDNLATSDDIGKVRIGDHLDGGVVYWVADNNNYKVVSLHQAQGLTWGASTSYVVPGARSLSDSRGNALAIKAAFDSGTAGVPITQATFAGAFPTSAWCYNYTGKDGKDPVGSWYLPSLYDLEYLYCAWNGYAPTTWEGQNPTIPPVPTAQAKFNQYLRNAGGTVGLVKEWYSTSTESNTSSVRNWFVVFSDANVVIHDKTHNWGYVRCIKNIAPPTPVVGDYYYTDGSYSTTIESGKTANGIIFYVDPANPKKFKVMALAESSTETTPTRQWAVSESYVIGTTGQSLTDGRGNAAAIKAYFDSNTTTVGSDFSVAFPAAAYCYNYKGKDGRDPQGTWYLPARNDVQYLWCAYNGVAPVIWDVETIPTSVLANTTVQGAWNARLTASGVGGTSVTTNLLWSSTEAGVDTRFAYYVNFSSGNTGGNTGGKPKNEDHYVRCVRDI